MVLEKIKIDTYLVLLFISFKASLPSLRVLITNQERYTAIKKVKNANEINVESNLFKYQIINGLKFFIKPKI